MVARLAGDESFAAELKARNERAAAEAASRPRAVQPQSPVRVATVSAPAGGEASEDDDGAPEWPDERTESAMVAELEQRAEVSPPTRRRTRANEDANGDALPELDTLIAAIPANVRTTLDELFRAQFTKVRRVPEAVLKSSAPKALPSAPAESEVEAEAQATTDDV